MNIEAIKAIISQHGIECFGEGCTTKTLSLLSDPSVRIVDGAPTKESVNQLLPTLNARLKNSLHTGKCIFGLEKAIEKLASMSGTDGVIGYGLISPTAAGNIYLSSGDVSLLGVTLVDR